MKIVIVLGAFLPVPPTMGGAVEKVWFALAGEFARRGHEVVLISRALDDRPREEVVDGVHHFRVEGFNAPPSLLLLKLYDLIYSWRAMSILPRCDVLVTNTFWLPILRSRAYVHVARYPKGQMRFYRRVARLQAPSRSVADAISDEAPNLKDKVSVVPYPAPRATAGDEPPPVEHRSKIILYVGRVHPEKGVHLLVDAFTGKARTIFADWTLVIVGPTDEKFGGGGEAYRSSLCRAGDEKVLFTGGIFDPADLEQRFRSARLFVYPSLAQKGESFGLAPLEAMTHRCAVLVSSLDCFQDFVRENETGFFFDHRAGNASASLAEKLEEIVADPAALARVAGAGYRKSQEYSLERVADQFLDDFASARSHG